MIRMNPIFNGQSVQEKELKRVQKLNEKKKKRELIY